MQDNASGPAAAGGAPRRGALRSPGRALLVSLPMILLSAFMLMGGPQLPGDPLRAISLLATYLFVNVLFFEMVRTGKTERYRAALFIATAALFVVSFIANLIEVRGSMQLTAEETATGQTPFCHMVIPMTLIPAALTKTIIFPGHLLGGFAPIAGMFALWIGASLALGRGFCAWGCFFGGLEDGFSRLRRKPLIRNIAKGWTYAPYAILLAVVLLSAAALSPVYCEWLCPFKSVTEFFEVNSTKTAIQAGIFASLFAGLVVALPIATRKRTQCGLFCPFGAFQSFTNKIDPFAVRVSHAACNDCNRCEAVCPTFSIDAESIARGGTRASCCKCGRCVDACASGAITYHVKGTGGGRPERARMLFIYPAFLFLATFGGGMIQDGLRRLLLLATTGRMIH
jgi:ferredoxin-type protein NapH